MLPSNAPPPGDELRPPATRPRRFSGCLAATLVVGFIALFGAACGTGMILLISTGMRHTDAYRLAMQTAQASPCVVQRLGTPLRSGWWVDGGIRTMNSEGFADLDFSVSGPKSAGRMHVVANKLEGAWYLQVLNVSVNGQRINALAAPASCD